MENNTVSFVAYESQGARLERGNKRLFILSVILMILLLATNGAWIYYESTFSTTQETKVEQEIETGEGDGDTIITGVGDVNHGESKTKNNDN